MTTSIESSDSEASATPPRPPTPPDRTACKKRSKRTPNGRVWAHRISDLRHCGNEYWSPSMAKVADAYSPPYQQRVCGNDWQPEYDEPEPRKLRIWPVLTVVDGVQCNEELLDLKDDTVPNLDSANDVDERSDEQVELNTADEPEIPKLEQRISRDLLPEILMVKDPANRTRSRAEGEQSEAVVEYHRVYPRPKQPLDANEPRTSADLELPSSVPRIGHGSHANVYPAHLTLDERFRLVTSQPPSETARRPATVRVAAKIPSLTGEDLTMIKNEARTYNAFPDHLSEDWSGFNAIGEAANRYTDGLVPATAVVPKFYGYFVPSEELAETSNSRASPILLMEECGRPIEPKEMQQAERNICFTFPHSLYYEDFIQNSFSARNILVQPGPLTHPPDQRSLVTPSFRLIDFGRARWLDGSFDERVAFSNERKMAEDTIFGKKRKFVQGHDVWCEGKLERAFWMWAREWVFKPHDPHHHWHMDPFAKYV